MAIGLEKKSCDHLLAAPQEMCYAFDTRRHSAGCSQELNRSTTRIPSRAAASPFDQAVRAIPKRHTGPSRRCAVNLAGPSRRAAQLSGLIGVEPGGNQSRDGVR